MTPTVTVLMPVHNGEAYVEESARSILNQSFPDFEFLVVDDASTDSTVSILERLNDPRLKLIKSTDRLRFSGALNLGLSLSRGEFIARMDADDIARPDRLALQVARMQAQPSLGICGGLAVAFGLRRGPYFRPPMTHGEIQAYTLFDSPFVHPTVMLRRSMLEQHGLRFDPAFCPADDYELWSRAIRHFESINLNRTLLDYRVHATSLTESEWGDMDSRAAAVAARELTALNLPATDDTLRFHRNLGRGRCFPIHQLTDLIKAESWLQTLLRANSSVKRYPEPEFARTVAGIWFSACYHAGTLGTTMLRRYLSSPLRRAKPTLPKEWAALLWVATRPSIPH